MPGMLMRALKLHRDYRRATAASGSCHMMLGTMSAHDRLEKHDDVEDHGRGDQRGAHARLDRWCIGRWMGEGREADAPVQSRIWNQNRSTLALMQHRLKVATSMPASGSSV